MLLNSSTKLFLLLAVCLAGCGTKAAYKRKNEAQCQYISAQGITACNTYESDCNGGQTYRASHTQYDAQGNAIVNESYQLDGNVFISTTQVYENGLMTEKNYRATPNNPQMKVRYEYNDKGQQVKYVVFDAKDQRVSLHKIERQGNKEYVSDYDDKGKLANYRTVTYDEHENPLIFGSRKVRYTYNSDGLITEMASVDTLSGSFMRKVYDYKNLLPVKETYFYDDTCQSVIRYEYTKAKGVKWN